MPPKPSKVVSVRPREGSSTPVRRLTAAGIERAKEFLAYMRENPRAKPEPPRELLFGERFSRPFRENVLVERRSFRTRRDVGEYFAPRFKSIGPFVADHAGLWSWLGIYFFADTVQVEDGIHKLSPVDETFVFADSNDRHAYRHYLRGAWRLYESHGESVAFLLDQDLTSFGDLAERVFGSLRIFNSAGVIQLILRLYTRGSQQKRGFGRRPGGLRHLIRVLDQLERTYDVYGMTPDALIRVLPDEFQRWDGGSARRAVTTALVSEHAADTVESSPNLGTHAEVIRDKHSTVRGAPVETVGERQPSARTSADADVTNPRPAAEPEPPSVHQTLLDLSARIEQQGEVTWADPREHLKEGSKAWEAYVAVCGAPERRLFRTAFLHRLNEVLASLD